MENFTEEILTQLIEDAFELKASVTTDFERGILYGYYNTITKILNQAEAFGVFDKLPDDLKSFLPEDLLKID